MVRKIVGIGVTVLLVAALVGGGAYLLLRDTDNGSGGGNRGQAAAAAGAGAGGGRGNSGTAELGGVGGNRGGGETLSSGVGGGRGNSGTADLGGVGGNRGGGETLSSGAGGIGGNRGGNAAAGGGTGTPAAAVAPADWVTVSGVVVEMDEELVVRTADGTEETFTLGPSTYRDASGVAIAVGDEVRVTGFYEDGELKAATVENLSSGQALALRDESGRPLWSGRGRGGQ